METTGYTFLKGEDFEQLMAEEKFIKAEEITMVHLLNFKHNRVLFVKIPSRLCEKNPYDGFVWSQTKTDKNKKILSRHQPTYSKMEIYGETVVAIKCTHLHNDTIHKQVFPYKDDTYSYYFCTSLGEIIISDAPCKRLSKSAKEELKKSCLPLRTVGNAVKVARQMGISVTTKQVANLARSTSTTITCKTGPRSKTSLKMAEELKTLYPDTVWFETNDANLLSSFTFIQIFDEACLLYLKGCPTQERWDDWNQFVDIVASSDEATRRTDIKQLLRKHPSGVFFPSRLHVDTTFNLGDTYVTVVLGESGNFQTKASKKARVFPIAYMLHSSKESDNHALFARRLKERFDFLMDPSSPRKIPCILVDGEYSLDEYPTALNTMPIRCDVHLLSLLTFNYGGKTAAHQAKPFLFGTMKNGKWKTGVLGCFDELSYQRRLSRIESLIDIRIYRWLKTNKQMLMECSSALAKLRAGHILQFSTNNQNETFNGILKATLSRRNSAPELIRKMNVLCHEKLREMWLSALDGSELVTYSGTFDGDTVQDRIDSYSSSGLISARLLAFDVPLRIAKGFDLQKMHQQDLAFHNLRLMSIADDTFHLSDTSLPTDDRSRFIQVLYKDGMLDCWQCITTLPDFLCCHVVYCLSELTKDQINEYWECLLGSRQSVTKNTINAFDARSGFKKSDRLGTKQSASNHVRRIADISSLTFASDISLVQSPSSHHNATSSSYGSPSLLISQSPPRSSSSPQNPTFAPPSSSTPLSASSSAERRSQRARRPNIKYTPPRTYDTSGDSTIY